MAESIGKHLSELVNQVNHFYDCIKQGNLYPAENRKIIESKFDFFLIDSTDFEKFNEEEINRIKTLLNKINAIINNESAINKIVSYIFSFVDLHADYNKIKADFSCTLFYYTSRLEALTTRPFLADSRQTVENQQSEKYIFKSSIARELANFEFNGKELFDDDDYDILLKNINFLISNKSNEISPELDFKASYDYIAYYILNEILQIIKTDFELDPKVKINGKPYSTQARSEAITKNFGDNRKTGKKPTLIKSLINSVDDLIKNNIMPG